jgi:hypothetical protein
MLQPCSSARKLARLNCKGPYISGFVPLESIQTAFARHTKGLKAEAIGIVERQIRGGYSGLVFLKGIAR